MTEAGAKEFAEFGAAALDSFQAPLRADRAPRPPDQRPPRP